MQNTLHLLMPPTNNLYQLLIALMHKLELHYVCAINGREALDSYRDNPHSFLLILMDMSMPIMDGFTATAKIRETERQRRLPRTRIVALTGVTSEESKQRAFSSGIDEFYSKPVHLKELRDLVDQAKEKSKRAKAAEG